MARLTRPWWRYTAVWAGLSCLGVSINIFGHAREATGSIGMAAFFAFSAWCAIASAVLATIEIMRERHEQDQTNG